MDQLAQPGNEMFTLFDAITYDVVDSIDSVTVFFGEYSLADCHCCVSQTLIIRSLAI